MRVVASEALASALNDLLNQVSLKDALSQLGITELTLCLILAGEPVPVDEVRRVAARLGS